MHARIRLSLVMFGVAVCFLYGCSGKSGRPVLALVSGTVTYKGQPLVGASVTFFPDQKGYRSATAKTDEDGLYRLWSGYDEDNGAPVGNNAVAISLRGPPKKAHAESGEAPSEEMIVGDPIIPPWYFDPETSGFRAQVIAGQKNVFDFALTDEPLTVVRPRR